MCQQGFPQCAVLWCSVFGDGEVSLSLMLDMHASFHFLEVRDGHILNSFQNMESQIRERDKEQGEPEGRAIVKHKVVFNRDWELEDWGRKGKEGKG